MACFPRHPRCQAIQNTPRLRLRPIPQTTIKSAAAEMSPLIFLLLPGNDCPLLSHFLSGEGVGLIHAEDEDLARYILIFSGQPVHEKHIINLIGGYVLIYNILHVAYFRLPILGFLIPAQRYKKIPHMQIYAGLF